MIYKIDKTDYFSRKFKKIPKDIQDEFKKILGEFVEAPFSQRFKSHKLKGTLKEYYSSRINFSYRFIWALEKEIIILVNIGDHSIYK